MRSYISPVAVGLSSTLLSTLLTGASASADGTCSDLQGTWTYAGQCEYSHAHMDVEDPCSDLPLPVWGPQLGGQWIRSSDMLRRWNIRRPPQDRLQPDQFAIATRSCGDITAFFDWHTGFNSRGEWLRTQPVASRIGVGRHTPHGFAGDGDPVTRAVEAGAGDVLRVIDTHLDAGGQPLAQEHWTFLPEGDRMRIEWQHFGSEHSGQWTVDRSGTYWVSRAR